MVGDALVVRAGEVVPVDGVVEQRARRVVDESIADRRAAAGRLRERGDHVRSGTSNAGEVFELRAIRPAAESAYAAVVRLVQDAESQKAPFVRLADRYAIFFLPLTIVVAGLAWALSGDPVRALAVFVVATPCPLILAAPIAFVSGISRAAKAGVIVKGGGVIEQLGKARTVLLDKTGTLTLGTPGGRAGRRLRRDRAARSSCGWPRRSTSSPPIRSPRRSSIDAIGRGSTLSFPEQVTEEPGRGIAGVVDGRRVAVGSATWLRARGHQRGGPLVRTGDGEPGRATIAVAVDGRAAGAIVMGDHVREDAPQLVAELRSAGIGHVAMVTGDRAAVGAEVGRALGPRPRLSRARPGGEARGRPDDAGAARAARRS